MQERKQNQPEHSPGRKNMVWRQIRNPPLLPGQRRFRTFTWVATAVVTYMCVFMGNWQTRFDENSRVGTVTVSSHFSQVQAGFNGGMTPKSAGGLVARMLTQWKTSCTLRDA